MPSLAPLRPASATPTPPPDLPPAGNEPRSRGLVVLVVSLVTVSVLVVLAVWLLYSALHGMSAKAPSAIVVPAAETARETKGGLKPATMSALPVAVRKPVLSKVVAVSTAIPGAAAKPKLPVAVIVTSSSTNTVTAATPPVVTNVPSVATGAVVRLPAPAVEAAAKPTTVAPAQGPVVPWPIVRVMGVMGQSDPRRGTAILDGQLVTVGESVKGLRLVGVGQNTVSFEYRGETRTVRVGQTSW